MSGSDAEIEPGVVDACIVVDRPRLAMAKLTNLFYERTDIEAGIHPTAVIADGAQLGENVAIGAHAYIGAGTVIGTGSSIHPQVYIAPGCRDRAGCVALRRRQNRRSCRDRRTLHYPFQRQHRRGWV